MASPLDKMRTPDWQHPTQSLEPNPLAGAEWSARSSLPDSGELFEHAPAGYLLLDAAGCIRGINRTGADMLGWDAGWLTGKPFSRWVESRDRKAFRQHLGRLRESVTAAGQELRVKNRAGSRINLRLESVADRLDGNCSRNLMIDVSGEQQFARRLRRLQMQQEYTSRLCTAGEFAASLAHDLNQPLGTIVLNCEAAMRGLPANGPAAADCREALQQATDAATFASKIVRHLRRFLRSESGMQQQCDFCALCNDVYSLLESDARDNDVDLRFSVPAALPGLFVVSVQIEQVLINLVRNSIDALQEQADGTRRIEITARSCSPDQVLIRVADNGPGLHGEVAAQMFQPFFTTRADGMGIGLSICRSIVEAHNGNLWADPDSREGAALCFTLPVYRAEWHA